MLRKVISGGQTGVDRAGLDAAMHAGIATGGFCPSGRKAEDGIIPTLYPLVELTSDQYCTRTEKNVAESDGTLILNKGDLTEGTRLTYEFTASHRKPCLIIQLDREVPPPASVIRWILSHHISTLNIAGPRESKFACGIYAEALAYLESVFRELAGPCTESLPRVP